MFIWSIYYIEYKFTGTHTFNISIKHKKSKQALKKSTIWTLKRTNIDK